MQFLENASKISRFKSRPKNYCLIKKISRGLFSGKCGIFLKLRQSQIKETTLFPIDVLIPTLREVMTQRYSKVIFVTVFFLIEKRQKNHNIINKNDKQIKAKERMD